MDLSKVQTANYKEKMDDKIPDESEIDFEDLNSSELKKLGRQVVD